MLRGLGQRQVRVRSARSEPLSVELRKHGFAVAHVDADELRIDGGTAEQVAAIAHSLGIPLHHIAQVEQSLEDAYLALTGTGVEHDGRRPDDAATTTEEAR
jgi:ABC-2 type transport system ATP-binding protein